MKKMFVILALFVLVPLTALSQTKLSDEDKELITERIKQKLDSFQDDLSMIAGRNDEDLKNRAVKSCLELFVEKGEPYIEYIILNGVSTPNRNTGVKIQTSSRNGQKRTPQLMKKYLDRMKGMLNYTNIVIEAADAVKVGDIYRQSDGRYISTATICQHFIGFRENYKVYEDYTLKTVKIYIDKEEIMTPDGTQIAWLIKLGDMNVLETWY